MALPLLAIGAGLGLAQGVAGLIGGNKANEEAKRLAASRPRYQISPYVDQTVDLAESELSTGMSADTRRVYEEGNDRALSSSIDAILKSGGSPNSIADVFDASVQGRSRLAQLQEQMRLQQINNVQRAWATRADEEAKAFEFNDWRKWADAAQANAQAKQNANANLWGGINTLGSAAIGYFGQRQQQQNFDNYFGGNNNSYMPQRSQFNYNPATTIANNFSNDYYVPSSIPMNGNPILSSPTLSGMIPTTAVNNGRPISF